jgi:pimeloyl-ACP methyl ester carboxylesterase
VRRPRRLRRLLHPIRWLKRTREANRPIGPDLDDDVLQDVERDSGALLVTFGGLAGWFLEQPPFEMVRSTGELPVKRIFVRDSRQAWYHRGISGHGDTFTSAAESLGELLGRYEVERLVMTGISMGGYAALAFGALLGADSVLAFVPQTVVDMRTLEAMDDHRWDEHLGELDRAGDADPRWVDLRTALPAARIADTRYEIYFAERPRADRLHAERMAGIDGVRLYRFGHGGHALARALRDNGVMEKVMRRALGLPTLPLAAVAGDLGETPPPEQAGS